jgi:hypothetical protein
MKARKDDGREDEERERARWSCLATDGASNVIFTHSMTRCGGAAARHLNLKPDRPVCLPTFCPVDRSVTGLVFACVAVFRSREGQRARGSGGCNFSKSNS